MERFIVAAVVAAVVAAFVAAVVAVVAVFDVECGQIVTQFPLQSSRRQFIAKQL